MKKIILKPRKKMTKAHVKSIAHDFFSIYGESDTALDIFVAGFLAGKGKLPDHHYRVCTKCFKLLTVDDFQKNRSECRYCRI